VALVGCVCFIISLFFAPLLSNIPPWATGGALMITGVLMFQSVTTINWNDKKQAVPALATIIIMPLTYSIAYGIIAGLLCAAFIYGGHYLWEICARRMSISDVIAELKSHHRYTDDVEPEFVTKVASGESATITPKDEDSSVSTFEKPKQAPVV
jgi:xanthine/uracil/vitamin C permease (AzgA family)